MGQAAVDSITALQLSLCGARVLSAAVAPQILLNEFENASRRMHLSPTCINVSSMLSSNTVQSYSADPSAVDPSTHSILSAGIAASLVLSLPQTPATDAMASSFSARVSLSNWVLEYARQQCVIVDNLPAYPLRANRSCLKQSSVPDLHCRRKSRVSEVGSSSPRSAIPLIPASMFFQYCSGLCAPGSTQPMATMATGSKSQGSGSATCSGSEPTRGWAQ